MLFQKGLGVPSDMNEALSRFTAAAAKKLPAAQDNLGFTHLNGLGVPRNEAEAARWFGLAAAQGDPIGEHRLALLLLAGKGVEKDTGKAVELLRHGADRGYVPAQVTLAIAFEAVRPSRTGPAYIWYRIAGPRTADAAPGTLPNNVQDTT